MLAVECTSVCRAATNAAALASNDSSADCRTHKCERTRVPGAESAFLKRTEPQHVRVAIVARRLLEVGYGCSQLVSSHLVTCVSCVQACCFGTSAQWIDSHRRGGATVVQ